MDARVVAVSVLGAVLWGSIAGAECPGDVDGDGKVTTDFAGYGDTGWAAALDGAGQIIVGGQARSGSNQRQFALARYNTDGALDGSFGVAGKVTTEFMGGEAFGADMKLDAAGRIVLTGAMQASATASDFALARYLGDQVIRKTYLPLVLKGS